MKTMSINIIVVEDYKPLCDVFIYYLSNNGYSATGVESAVELDEYFARHYANLLILDINLPGEDGFSIARRYRANYPEVNIIMLTTKHEVNDRITGYESGADIYLSKPVSVEELAAAIFSIKRRVAYSINPDNQIKFNVIKREVSSDQQLVQLTRQQAKILNGLIQSPKKCLNHQELLRLINKIYSETNQKALAVCIFRLNKKLSEIGLNGVAIKSDWNQSYQLTENIVIIAS
ncbi:MAG: response regulator transcription factor [Methylomonas sp.]